VAEGSPTQFASDRSLQCRVVEVEREAELVDTTRQAVRYAIPGALAALWFVIGTVLIIHARQERSVSAVLANFSDVGLAQLVALILPLGFLVYQIYYATDGPENLWGWFIARDRGSEILRCLHDDTIKLIEDCLGLSVKTDFATHIRTGVVPSLAKVVLGIRVRRICTHPVTVADLERAGHKWRYIQDDDAATVMLQHHRDQKAARKDRRDSLQDYRIRWYANSDSIRVLVDLISGMDGCANLRDSYRALADIYSAIGATKVAILGSAAAATTATFAFHWSETVERLGPVALALVPYLVATSLVSYQLTRNRRGARKTFVRTVQGYLSLYENRLQAVLNDSRRPTGSLVIAR
jgi:hypothetical protein